MKLEVRRLGKTFFDAIFACIKLILHDFDEQNVNKTSPRTFVFNKGVDM